MTDMAGGVFADKIALVTGGAQGMGRGIALRFAREGAGVVVADINEEGANRVADEIRALGRAAIAVAMDVASLPSINAAVDRSIEEFGRIDLLVNAAGLIRPRPFGDVTEEDWDVMFQINTRGLFFCMQQVAAQMADGGAIINIASIAGRGVLPSSSPPYAASKAAVINLTRSASRALAPRRIRVNAICPGTIDTEFQTKLDKFIAERDGLPLGESLRQWTRSVPLGRIGTVDDIADVVAFLAGPGASYITGQSINVDGGLVFS